jgi:hypothetical protein
VCVAEYVLPACAGECVVPRLTAEKPGWMIVSEGIGRGTT